MILEKLNRKTLYEHYHSMQETAGDLVIKDLADLLNWSRDQVLIGEIGAALETLTGEIEAGAETEKQAADVMAEVDQKLRRARADLILEADHSKHPEIEAPIKLLERALIDAKAAHRTASSSQLDRRQEYDRLTQFRADLKAKAKPEAANLRAALETLEN